jgi:hypothetical protein
MPDHQLVIEAGKTEKQYWRDPSWYGRCLHSQEWRELVVG